MTQHELAIHAMFLKAENAAKRRLPKGRPWARNVDNTYAYKVEQDRLGAPYAVFRDISWYMSRPGQNMARHGFGGAA